MAPTTPRKGSRRLFLGQGMGGAVAASVLAGTEADARESQNAPPAPVRACATQEAAVEVLRGGLDVLVVGGGPAGICAATQAARLGVRVLLVEKSGVLGGTTVLNGVAFPGLFHAWGKQIIAGIGWDLTTRAVAESGGTLPDFTDYHRPHPHLQVRVNSALYAALADELVLGAGAQVLFHAVPLSIERDGAGWQVQLATKEGPRRLSAQVAVDCTGDANLAGLAGFALDRSEALQPGTLIMRTEGYDPDQLDGEALAKAHDAAVASGQLRSSDFAGRSPLGFLRAHGDNAMHVIGIDGATSAGKTRAELLARQAMLRIHRFCRAQPGLEGFRIVSFATECGIRETRTIHGRKTVTLADYTSGKVWEDAVCHSFYPIDVHRASGHGIRIEPLREGVVPTIPLGAMLPRDGSRFMVAGRCVSGDQDANSAYRVQASCMAMGQAAGACAALAGKERCDVDEVPLATLRDTLRAHGAIVPEPV